MANITGTEAADTLQGSAQNDTISGLGGNDTLWGQAGDDLLSGGLGDDRLYGGAGNDQLDGGGTRPLPWMQGLPGDYDQALYDDLSAPIALNLSTLQVTGSASGTDVLLNIEALRGTGGADSVTGSLNALPLPLAAAGYQASLSWLGMGGSDTVTQARSTYNYWVDGIFASYIWSNAPLTVTANGAVVTVSYTASATGFTYANNQLAQPAGSDTLTLVVAYSDSRFSDNFNMSGLTENMAGNARNFVEVSTGNDTVTGNGDTALNVTSGWRVTSTTGKGVNFTLPGTGTATLNLTHLNWQDWSGQQVAMGQVTVSKIDEIRATDFDDTLTGGTYDDYEAFRGKGGNDSIDGGTGYDMADYMGSTAGVYVDLGMGTAWAMDSTNSSIGTDTLRGIEVIRGTNHADKFMASQFGKTAPAGVTVNVGSGIMGLSNGNSFEGRGGNDTVEGNGATRIDYLSAAAGVDADLQRGTAFGIVNDSLIGDAKDAATEAAKSIGVDSFTGVFRIRGSSLNDKLAGSAGGAAYGASILEAFEPGPGNDTIDGRSGWDEVYYNTGGWVGLRGLVVDMNITNGPNVTEDSFGGKDTLTGIEYIGGSAFNDNIKGSLTNAGLFSLTESFGGGKGNDTLDGGAQGYDEAAYIDSPQGVTVNLTTGTASDGWGTTDTLISIEGVEGSEWNDLITGSAGNNRLDGHGGNDTLNGGDGNDWVEYNNESGAVTVDLGAGSASGAAGTDVLTSIENAQGSIYGDKLTGSSAANVLEGLDGNDSLFGGAGNDSLLGGEGNDRLYGEAGDDLLSGGPRRNTNWGTGTSGDFDTADYNNLSSPISLNLQTLQVTGTSAGTDTLEGVEEVRATKGTDTVTGSLGLRSLALPSVQTGISWVGLGGSDTITQSQTLYAYWADPVYVDYAWSGTGIQAVATATNKISVSYAAGTMYWYGGSQVQGTDQLTYGSALGDTRWDDSINLSNFSVNMHGSKRSYVGLTSGNDTVVGNGDTTLSLLSSGSSASSQGNVGVNVTLQGNAETTVDLRHLSWQPLSSSTDRVNGGLVKFSGVDDVRGTNFNDTLTGGGYDDYEVFRGRAGNDSIDGRTGFDMSDYLGSSAGVQVLLAQGLAQSTSSTDTSIGVDTLRGIEAIRGTNFNDVYDARGYGAAGTANLGDRVFNLADGNSFEGRAGNDQILGNGSTRIDYQGAAVGVNVDLTRGSAFALGDASTEAAKSVGFDSFSGVFRVRGSSFGDLLTGGSEGRAYGTVWVEGFQPGAGNDTVDGKDGWDEVYYGDGSLNGLVVDKTVSAGPQVLNDGHGGQDSLSGIEYILVPNLRTASKAAWPMKA
jgi:Ca2+-binding RTX toxin-like protein